MAALGDIVVRIADMSAGRDGPLVVALGGRSSAGNLSSHGALPQRCCSELVLVTRSGARHSVVDPFLVGERRLASPERHAVALRLGKADGVGLRWIRIAVVVAVLLVISWFVFRSFAQVTGLDG